MADLPLKGIRVLDLSMVFAGPICTRVMADMGADVVKVEAIQRPDGVRGLVTAENDPQEEGWNRSGYYTKLNMNKYGITVDITNPKGQDIVKRLVKMSDVVIENYSPRVMNNLGLSYEVLRQIRPDIVMASLSGYGQTGPWAKWGAFGYTLEYACGLAHVTGYADSPPRKQGISFTDPWSGMLAAGLIVMALHYRRRTGKGQYIDLSQRDIGTSYLGEVMMDYVMNGRVQGRIGNRHPTMAPHGHYRCAGERAWVAIAVSNDDEWQALRKALGDPEWAQDPQFATVPGRMANQDFIDGKIEEWTEKRDHYTAMHELQTTGVPAGPVLNSREIWLEPHLKERGDTEIVEHPSFGRRPYPRQTPGWYSAWPKVGKSPRPAPKLGQHNEEILCGLLGLSKEELEQLAAEQVIGTKPITEQLPLEVQRQMLQRRLQMMQQVGKVEELDPNYREVLGINEEA